MSEARKRGWRVTRFFLALAQVVFALILMNSGLEHGLLSVLRDPVISNSASFFGGIFFLILGVLGICIIAGQYYDKLGLENGV